MENNETTFNQWVYDNRPSIQELKGSGTRNAWESGAKDGLLNRNDGCSYRRADCMSAYLVGYHAMRRYKQEHKEVTFLCGFCGEEIHK